MRHNVSFGRLTLLGVLLPVLCRPGPAGAQDRFTRARVIPRTSDEKALVDWATPLAGINVRRSHISPTQYYALQVDKLKTWPVYLAGKEPPGYWQMLQRVGPQPLDEPEIGIKDDGSVASLEEMFNPDRLKDSHTPGGYSPPGIRNRAIKGHEFGLGLNEGERSQLIAFLRTL